jgi:hypothetical protein
MSGELIPKWATRTERTCDVWGHVTGESVRPETHSPPVFVCDCDAWGHPVPDVSSNPRPQEIAEHFIGKRGVENAGLAPLASCRQ